MQRSSLRTERLELRRLAAYDARELCAFYERNAAYFEPWDPHRDASFYTVERQSAIIEAAAGEASTGAGARFAAFEPGGEEIVATINLSNIRRGVIYSAIVSYSVDERRAGRGYATELLQSIVAHAFGDLDLHRIEASYQPANRASGRVLEKAGFAVEGYARDYLFINGAWRDGVLVSRRNDAWRV